MSDKKHIDRLFQEKFKDFEAQPDAKIWKNIEHKLQESNSKQSLVFPLWKKTVGIAVVLITSLAIYNIYSNSHQQRSIVSKIPKNTSKNSLKKDNTIVKLATEKNSDNAEKYQKESNILIVSHPIEKNRLNTTNSKSSQLRKSTSGENNSIKNATAEKASNLSSYGSTKNRPSKNNSNKTEAVRFSKENITKSKNTNNSKSETNKALLRNSETKLIKLALATNNNKANKFSVTLTKQKNIISKNNRVLNKKNKITLNNNDTGIILTKDLQAKTMPISIISDSIISNHIVIRDSKSIEAAIQEAKEQLHKQEIGNRWTVASNIAPVYYNSLGKGSQFGSQFENNNISGETNTSYGLKLGYTLSKKLTLRSGINKLNLSYDTDDVIIFESLSNTTNNKPIENINFFNSGSDNNLAVLNGENLSVLQINGDRDYNAALSQRINYLEIPLELEYKLTNNRFDINIIGGFSTFVLEDNQIVSEFNGYKTEIGKANNINNISFSTNIGIGLNYKFSKSFVYNFEPTFKYQINGFSNTAGSFNPYIIGVYTGFSYKF